MAVTYGFYDSLNHDRLYNAQQMSAIFDGIINDGVFMSVGNQFHTVAGTGMQVIVKSGRAWFDSTWTLNDAEYPLSIDAADVLLTRIDAVVLEVNSEVATRANTIKVVKGTPASTPAKPTLTNTATIHQHALAYVTVAKNTTAITNSMIEIVVGKTETPYVTAILQTTDITDLFKKWENDFQVWFETVKGTLDGDVALNLQNQIDHCVKKADKATSADIEAGTADKWVDASLFSSEQYAIGDLVPSLVDRTTSANVMLVTNKDISLDKNTYNVLYNKIGYRYGCKVTSITDSYVMQNAFDLYGQGLVYSKISAYAFFKHNGNIYTATIIPSGDRDYRSYAIIIYKNDTIIFEKHDSYSSSSYMNHLNVFSVDEGFYFIGSSSSDKLTSMYWSVSTNTMTTKIHSFESNAYIYTINGDYATYIYIKQGNNLLIHHVYKGSSSAVRCMFTLSPTSITYTNLGTGNVNRMILDNNTIYGIKVSTGDFYIVDKNTGLLSNIDSSSVPKHVADFLIDDNALNYPNRHLLYSNLDGTKYVYKIASSSVYVSSSYVIVTYNNNIATVKPCKPYNDSTTGNQSINDYCFYLYTLLFSNSQHSDVKNEYGERLYINFNTVTYNYRPQTLYYDPPDYKIYIPFRAAYTSQSKNVKIESYVFDPSFFKASYKDITFTAYCRMR